LVRTGRQSSWSEYHLINVIRGFFDVAVGMMVALAGAAVALLFAVAAVLVVGGEVKYFVGFVLFVACCVLLRRAVGKTTLLVLLLRFTILAERCLLVDEIIVSPKSWS
jgi:hypothetical protein